MDKPLDGVTCKLYRANEHLATLRDEVDAYFKSDPYDLIGEFEPDTGWYIFRWKVRPHPAGRWAVILGDCLHNLRSGLDHLVWQLVLKNGQTPGRHTQFPIFTVEADYKRVALGEGRNSPGMLAGVAPEHVALIEKAQPYNAGADAERTALAILSRLSNADKHHTIHTVLARMGGPLGKSYGIFGGNADAGPIGETVYKTGSGAVDGTEFARCHISPVGPDPQVSMQLFTTLDIAFDLESPVRTTMVGLLRQVARILDTFEPFFEPTV